MSVVGAEDLAAKVVAGEESAPKVEFSKAELLLNNIKLVAEIADTDDKRNRGLMFRQSLPENQGMLFVFDREQVLHFWMKNTFIPLSIGFFDKKGQLLEVIDMEPVKSILQAEVPRYQSRRRSALALEMNQGWFKKHKIPLGAQLKLLKSSSSELLNKRVSVFVPLPKARSN